jgi:hypothetical protein
MYHPTIFFDPTFVINVIAGWVLTLVGALVLLLAAIWSVVAGEWLRGEPRPAAWRGLCAVGVAFFIAGWVWQIVGYYRVGALTW